jgi:hypothetical protein
MTDGNNLIDVLYSSFAIAGFFPPVEAFGSQFFDGSTIWDIDIFTAVNKCKAQGFAEKDIVIDVILTSAANLQKVDASGYKSLSMLFRYLEITSFYGSMDGLLRAKFAYPHANFRYAISPSTALPSSLFPMNLSKKQITDMIALGESDAKAAIAKGKGVSVEHLLHYHALKKVSDSAIEGMTLGDFLEAKENGTFDADNNASTDPSFVKVMLTQ